MKSKFFPIYLLTYEFKMCYFDSHPPSHPPSICIPTNTLSRYLQNPTYMATPTDLISTLIDPLMVKNNQERIK